MTIQAEGDHTFRPERGSNKSAQGRAKRLISRVAPPWVIAITNTQP
ncbi:MAG: hypothetical protein ACE5EQ_06185 [Phycisphaerae bacterium]